MVALLPKRPRKPTANLASPPDRAFDPYDGVRGEAPAAGLERTARKDQAPKGVRTDVVRILPSPTATLVRDPLGEANVSLYEARPLSIERPLIRPRATHNGLHVTPNRKSGRGHRQGLCDLCGQSDGVSVYARCDFSPVWKWHSFRLSV